MFVSVVSLHFKPNLQLLQSLHRRFAVAAVSQTFGKQVWREFSSEFTDFQLDSLQI